MVLLIQGLIILFSGGLAYMFNPAIGASSGCRWQCHAAPREGRMADLLQFLLTIDATLRVATPLILCAMAGTGKNPG